MGLKPLYKPGGFFTFGTVLITVLHPESHRGTGIPPSITSRTIGDLPGFLNILSLS